MSQRRPISGRPEGTDGSDFNYRMTVDPRYTKVAKGKSRLKFVIFLQVVIQLLGVFYVYLYPPKAGVFNPLTIAALLSGTILYSMGEIGRRQSRVNLLKVYMSLSEVATLFAVVVTARHSIDFKRDQGKSDVQYSSALWGMHPVDVFSYSHILLGGMVEIYQVFVTSYLIKNMTPPKIE